MSVDNHETGFGAKLPSSNLEARMSALGQKQTQEPVSAMSALPPKADIETQPRDVRFEPKADIGQPIRSSRPPRQGQLAAPLADDI